MFIDLTDRQFTDINVVWSTVRQKFVQIHEKLVGLINEAVALTSRKM